MDGKPLVWLVYCVFLQPGKEQKNLSWPLTPSLRRATLSRWALKHGCPYDATLCAGAARGGHLSILRGARKRSFPWDTRTTMWAAAGGHIRVLKWARKNGCRWKLKKCYRSADRHGHAHVMQWIEKLSRWCASGSSEMLVVGREQKSVAAGG